MDAKHECEDEWATSSKDDEATSKDGDKRGDPSDAEICARVAAFLFEALEDESSPEFRALDGFQRAHLDAFGAAEEISFEQEALHREFLALLERTVERFVEDDVGASPGRFAAAVRAGLEARSGDAGEILDALFDLADLACWAEAMRERRRLARPRPPARAPATAAAKRVVDGLASTPLGRAKCGF